MRFIECHETVLDESLPFRRSIFGFGVAYPLLITLPQLS